MSNTAQQRQVARPRRFAEFAIVTAALCTAASSSAGAGAAPVPGFDPISFFSGATDSVGSLKKAFSAAKPSHVTGFGALRGTGVFVLDQTVMITGQPVTKRQWLLHQIAPGHFGGTVSDASSPVTIDVAGNRLLIRYTMKSGLKVESVLTIAPDGRSGTNVSKIKKWGMGVATLSETIRKQ